jgi:hypothetical protein
MPNLERDEVDPVPTERVATRHPAGGQEATPPGAVALDRLLGIDGAARIEAARGHAPRTKSLVDVDCGQHSPLGPAGRRRVAHRSGPFPGAPVVVVSAGRPAADVIAIRTAATRSSKGIVATAGVGRSR